MKGTRRAIVNIAVAILLAAIIFNAGTVGYCIFIGLFGYFALALATAAVRTVRNHKGEPRATRREYVLKLTACLMGLFFVTGTIIYVITFLTIGRRHDALFNNAELVVRSMICSLDMFMLDVDSNILDRLDEFPMLKGAIVVQAALSFLCTIALLVSLVLSRAKAYYKLHRRFRFTPGQNHLYIFFGLNDPSRLLAADVRKRDPHAVILFVERARVGSEDDSDSWSNIIGLLAPRQKAFELAEDFSAYVDISTAALYDVDDESIAHSSGLFALTGLRRTGLLIEQIATHSADSQLHIFFLTESEDENIRSILNLAKDKTITESARQMGARMRIYCHARYNGANRVVEDLAVRKNLNVELIDSSHLAVELLKSKGAEQPVRFARLSPSHPTMVESPLEALIVGFGEVGRDAFRFIYEFGTFITPGADGSPQVAKPRITAIDSRMKLLEGSFRANTPAINFDIEQGGNVDLRQLDCGQYEFYAECLSPEKCLTLNYIVVALGDDDANIALAVNIFNRIRRYRKTMANLCIMVRCLTDEKRELMEKTAHHFNRGDGDSDVIRLFGNPKEIYSYDIIVRENLIERGKRFFANYMRIRGEEDDWNLRRKKMLQPDADGNLDLNRLQKLRRQESQDMANALHADSKMWLLANALDDSCDIGALRATIFDSEGHSSMDGASDTIFYPNLTPAQNLIMLNLAMLEHARWNAAHELMGYLRAPDGQNSCDERTRTHNCLRPWSELDAESRRASSADWTCDYKAYDFSVVDTSIFLNE